MSAACSSVLAPGFGSKTEQVFSQDRRSRIAASVLACLAAISIWVSLGIQAITGGDASRIAVFPSLTVLGGLLAAAAVVSWLGKWRVDQVWPLAISLILWLPFLPGPIPNAFLIWQGPIEGVVWAVVAAGLLAASPGIIPRLLGDPAVAPWVAAVAISAASLAAFSNVRDVVPGGDEPHYLAATQSLLHDRDLKVANNYANGEYLDYFAGRL